MANNYTIGKISTNAGEITGYFYLSKKVSVFPCSYRGYTITEAGGGSTTTKIFDPESRLETEKNRSTHFTPIPSKSSYVTKFEQIIGTNKYKLEFLLDGYKISIDEFEFPKVSETGWSIVGNIKTLEYSDDTSEDSKRSTRILSTLINGVALDQIIANSSEYYFTGFALVESSSVANAPALSSLKLFDQNNKVLWHARTLDQILCAGDGDHSLKLKIDDSLSDDSNKLDNQANGTGSIALGEKVSVSGNNSASLGKNNTVSSNDSMVFGNGNTSNTGDSNFIAGSGNITSGNNSIILGKENNSGLGDTILIGQNLTSSKADQIIIGKNNLTQNADFIIANGTHADRASKNPVELTYDDKIEFNNLDVTIDGDLTVNNNTTLSGNLAVTGAADFSNTLNVTGATQLSSTLTVDGETTLNNNLSVDSNLIATGLVAFGNAPETSEPCEPETLAELTVYGDVDFTGNLNVSEALEVGGALDVSGSNNRIESDLSVANVLITSNSIKLGNIEIKNDNGVLKIIC